MNQMPFFAFVPVHRLNIPENLQFELLLIDAEAEHLATDDAEFGWIRASLNDLFKKWRWDAYGDNWSK